MQGRPAEARFEAGAGVAPAIPTGDFVTREGETWYRIATYQRLEPFLMTVASDTDLWMFIASGGGLTAGRVDAEGSLFPYRTVDQLHEAHHHTGPVTLIRVEHGQDAPVLWEPFHLDGVDDPRVERNLYKNVLGNRLIFEEIRHDLGLAFRYRWAGCDRFGWVRSATLENRGATTLKAELLDGLRNVLPWGAPLALYQQAGNLVDAYKTTEVDPETGLGIFSLTAGITDRAEALEVLRTNTVWCLAPEPPRVHLSLDAVADFRAGRVMAAEQRLDGARGNYLASWSLELEAGAARRWHLVGDVGRDHVQIAELRQALREGATLDTSITDALDEASAGLRRLVAGADGLQLGGRPEAWSHHLANVLFNCMRGGVFTENHELPVDDFRDFLAVRNREVLARQVERLAGWPATMTVGQLFAAADETRDADLQRLAREYLPLSFGRRHGDPSRPWNRFEIRVRDRNGGRALHYEGNWRDVFQNWEALATAFPGFLPSFVAKFVNASTVDGFNPYRITRDGVDWETVSPDDPWSNIGYWGDHQIVYLLKLLEALQQHDPDALDGMLGAEIFSYAEVPYRIKPYAELLRDPGATIVFDTERAARIEARCARIGSDGKLVHDADGKIRRANLLEKLLVPALSKLSNLVPDGGIWMNTQRPEWNDANNALAGGGISVVTLCYLRRYLAFLSELLTRHPDRELPVAAEVVDWFDLVSSTLESERSLLGWDRLDELDRRRLLDMLGGDFSAYRDTVYAHGFSSRRDLGTHQVAALCRTALAWVDHGIAANRRQDGLYHAYNLLQLDDEGRGIRIGRLPVMLEGQVAVLSSGAIDPAESLAVLEHLFASDLYRPDQRSFMLYPERRLPGFLERNTVPAEGVAAVPLLQDLLAAGDPSLLARDRDGVHRFHGDLRNREDLAEALGRLARDRRWRDAVERDRAAVLALFEEVFQHASYTGRSGVMYGYEGLGCIYWHMVAKLLLAAQENVLRAERDEAPPPVREGLVGMYYRIRAGIGYERTVVEYGAFPTDPYSHTPPDGGARQPGMTGQVKEEILTRLGELGVRVDGGLVRFAPTLLEGREFLAKPADFDFYDLSGRERSIALDAGSLAFTLCQTPVVYRRGEGEAAIRVVRDDGTVSNHAGDTLDATTSMQLFAREGRLDRIEVTVPASALRDR